MFMHLSQNINNEVDKYNFFIAFMSQCQTKFCCSFSMYVLTETARVLSRKHSPTGNMSSNLEDMLNFRLTYNSVFCR